MKTIYARKPDSTVSKSDGKCFKVAATSVRSHELDMLASDGLYNRSIIRLSHAITEYPVVIRIFGNPTFWVNEEELHFNYEKVRAMLLYLIIENANGVAREHLADILWPEKEHVAARQNLRQALATCKKIFGNRFEMLVSSAGRSLHFVNSENVWCDVVEFNRLLVRASHAAAARDVRSEVLYLRGVISLVSGEFAAHLPFNLPDEFRIYIENRRIYYQEIVSTIKVRLHKLGVKVQDAGDTAILALQS